MQQPLVYAIDNYVVKLFSLKNLLARLAIGAYLQKTQEADADILSIYSDFQVNRPHCRGTALNSPYAWLWFKHMKNAVTT